MCLKTRLVNAIVAVKQVRQRSQQRKRNVLSVSDRHVTKPKITFSTRTLESTSTSLQVKEQLTLSCPATKAHEHCNSGGMSGRCSTRAHVSVPKGRPVPTSEAQACARSIHLASPRATCKGQTHRGFYHSGIFWGLAKTHNSHALELVLLISRLTPDPRVLVPLSFQPVCMGHVPSCEAESDHSHGYIY